MGFNSAFKGLIFYSSTNFPHRLRHNWGIYHIVGRPFPFSLDISPFPELSAIVSQLFQSSDISSNLWPKNSVSVVITDFNQSAKNYPYLV